MIPVPDRPLLFLDFDGTLTEIAPRPDAVQVEPGLVEDLERLRARLPVTGREAEGLLWLSRGKSSRDIGEILGLSHRTVTKHLEGIYAKLGVENRTAASIIAARHLEG